MPGCPSLPSGASIKLAASVSRAPRKKLDPFSVAICVSSWAKSQSSERLNLDRLHHFHFSNDEPLSPFLNANAVGRVNWTPISQLRCSLFTF